MKEFYKYAVWGFIIFFFLSGLFVANKAYRLDVRVFPINAYIISSAKNWSDLVNLVPQIFSKEDSLQRIERELKRSGYVRLTEYKDYGRLIETGGWRRVKGQAEKNKYVYVREAHTLVCNIVLYVFLDFDNNASLKSAQGTQQEHGCL